MIRSRIAPVTGVVVAASGVLGLAATGRGQAYNVVLITIDTLRADRLGCYGYSLPTSPHLDRFARHAVLYADAFSTSSFTPPAHASLLTSRYVHQHGKTGWRPLDDSNLTLAETLRENGFRTGASVNLNLLSRQDFQQGFDWLREEEWRDGTFVVHDALMFLNDPSEAPFFLWLHLYDVHRPYGSTAEGRQVEWIERFGGNGRQELGDSQPDDYGLSPERVRERGLTESDLRSIADRYDGGIAYADRAVAPLLARLSTPAHLESTIVVITSDHGENLLEHRSSVFDHDHFLYEEVTRIPLLIRAPGIRPGAAIEKSLVSLVDVAPTVLELLGLPRPEPYQGTSLVPLRGGEHRPPRAIFMQARNLKGVRTDHRVVIHDDENGRTEFLDLAGKRPRSYASPETDPDRRLRGMLDSLLVAEEEVGPEELDPEVLEQLKALGYVD